MTDSSRRRRLLGRRLQVIRHAPPEEALAAMLEPPTDTLPAVQDPALEALAAIESLPLSPVLEERPCCNFREELDRPCRGVQRFRAGDLQAACDECGGWCGVAAPCRQADVSRETSPYVAGGQVPRPALDSEPVAALQEEPPPLSRARINRLEALTAQWVRDVRVGGPGPDDTLLYGAPTLPPVPPARQEPPRAILETPPPTLPPPEEVRLPAEIRRQLEEEDRARQLEEEPHRRLVREHLAAVEAARPPARVSDWSSRHDPRSLEYAVRAKLARPVPLQNFLLERGPILDQGTTPPLSVREASACVGMAVAAAANVLELESRPVYSRAVDAALLGVEDARRLYARAQELDHVSGEAYAGTSVLAGMKAGQEAGYWDTYLWALGGTRDVAQALLQLRAPVVLGLPWFSGLEEPDALGVIRPGGIPAGGHALIVVGLRLQLPAPPSAPGPYFILQQSRGPAEGNQGLVYLHHAHLAQLLAGVGEAGVPLPRWGGLG